MAYAIECEIRPYRIKKNGSLKLESGQKVTNNRCE